MKIQHSMFALRARLNGLGVIRVAVAAPRSLGRAVARNRSRRRLREAKRTESGGASDEGSAAESIRDHCPVSMCEGLTGI